MIVGLIGAPSAGKDLVADLFVKYKDFEKISFADKIKEGYFNENGYTEEQFKDARGTPLEVQIRNGLWKYSKRVCKKQGKNYFVNQVFEKIYESPNSVIIPDIRTELELQTAKSAKALIFLVIRNYRIELEGEYLKGTKLKLKNIIDYPKYWNTEDELDKKELFYFYEMLLFKIMNTE